MKGQMKSSIEPFHLYCVNRNHQHIQPLGIQMPSTSTAESQSSSFVMTGNVTFNNLHGCTVNITHAPTLILLRISLMNSLVISPCKLGDDCVDTHA